jgi:hypothetical protein
LHGLLLSKRLLGVVVKHPGTIVNRKNPEFDKLLVHPADTQCLDSQDFGGGFFWFPNDPTGYNKPKPRE